jgi:hypothetical protein
MGYMKSKDALRRIEQLEVEQVLALQAKVPYTYAKGLQIQKQKLIEELQNTNQSVGVNRTGNARSKSKGFLFLVCYWFAVCLALPVIVALSFTRGYKAGLRSAIAADRQQMGEDAEQLDQINSKMESIEYHQLDSFLNRSKLKTGQ